MKEKFTLTLVAILLLPCAEAFLSLPRRGTRTCLSPNTICHTRKIPDDESGGRNKEEEELPVIAESTVRIDDGGSDLTDRFKYKVNALMGNFDPPPGSVDDENQNGNIIDALTIFPTRYSFNVVGRTGGDEIVKEEYVEDVKRIVASSSGDGDGLEMRVTPRGKNFTRLSVSVMVESAAVINGIYDELATLETTVMRY